MHWVELDKHITDGLVFGGDVPGNTAATENWNGTTWTELADLALQDLDS
jgi:hypothetical protein